MGSIKYSKSDNEKKCYQLKRSLFVVKDVKKGEIFTDDNVKSIRPGDGLHTRYYDDILGKKAKINISYGTPLSWELIE